MVFKSIFPHCVVARPWHMFPLVGVCEFSPCYLKSPRLDEECAIVYYTSININALLICLFSYCDSLSFSCIIVPPSRQQSNTWYGHSLGQAENARRHICYQGYQPDANELQKLQALETHLRKCTDARKIGDWRSALREVDAAIAAGVDASPQVSQCIFLIAVPIQLVAIRWNF